MITAESPISGWDAVLTCSGRGGIVNETRSPSVLWLVGDLHGQEQQIGIMPWGSFGTDAMGGTGFGLVCIRDSGSGAIVGNLRSAKYVTS